jgi:phosphonate transport system substrate-binding protein
MKDKVDLSQIKIIGHTDYFPNWPVFAAPGLNKEAAAKIRAALLQLKPSDPRSVRILRSSKLAGFVEVSDRDYDEIRQAARLVGML